MEYIFLFFGIISVVIAILGVILVPIIYLITGILTTCVLIKNDLKDINKK
jgi:hypothetical protein